MPNNTAVYSISALHCNINKPMCPDEHKNKDYAIIGIKAIPDYTNLVSLSKIDSLNQQNTSI